MSRNSWSLGGQHSQRSPPILFSLEATPQHQTGRHLLGEAKSSFCGLKGQSPGQEDRHPRADALRPEGEWSDGLRKGCPPNIPILAADGCVLPAGLHIHVVEGRLPHHVVCPRKLHSISRLQGWRPQAQMPHQAQGALLLLPLTSCDLREGNGSDPTPHPQTHCPIQGRLVTSPSAQCGSRCSCLLHS